MYGMQPGASRARAMERPESASGGKGLWRWWLGLTAPAGTLVYDRAQTRAERERLRRAGLTSAVAPFVLLAPLLLVQQAKDPGTLAAIIVLLCAAPASLVFNRSGHQVVASLVLILAMDATIEGALLTAHGGLGAGWLLTFDLFIIPLITVGVLLSRRYLWVFALLHIAFILGDFYLLPHTSDLVALIALWQGPGIAFARPVIIQLGGALLSFVEIRSTDEAISRADRAEDIAELERRQLEQRRQLELGVKQLLEVHIRIANGDYSARAALREDNELFVVGRSLNNLVDRLQKAGELEYGYKRAEDEAHRLEQAIDDARAGRRPLWPAPSGTLLDGIKGRLAGRSRQLPPSGFRGPEADLSTQASWTGYQPANYPAGTAPIAPNLMPSPQGYPPTTSSRPPNTGSLSPWSQRNAIPDQNVGRPEGTVRENPWFLPPES